MVGIVVFTNTGSRPERGEVPVAGHLRSRPSNSATAKKGRGSPPARDAYAYFDLYWSSDPTVLLPFNYHPAQGGSVSRAYPAREGAKGFVRAVRSLGINS